jgi:probable rRNA maturation factor
LERLLAELAPEAESLAVRFVSDREMRRLNATYRDKDYPTDVLSFPGTVDSPEPHLGDLVISVPTARRQARIVGHPVARELRLLLLHGLLHLLGYDHETDDGAMQRLERRLRVQWLGPGETA